MELVGTRSSINKFAQQKVDDSVFLVGKIEVILPLDVVSVLELPSM